VTANGGLRWLWRNVLTFLEVISLREERQEDHAAQLSNFRLYHTEFRKLLSANNSFLETMAELERKLRGEEFLDSGFVKRKSVRAVADVHRMVESLSVISEDRYPLLSMAFDRITGALTSVLEEAGAPTQEELVLQMDTIQGSHSDLVGGKMSNLGEIRNVLGLPAPDGFVVTTAGFRLLLEEGGIQSAIQDELMGALSAGDVVQVSRGVLDRILSVRVPVRLQAAILDAYDALAVKLGAPPRLAVRSSAVGEDSDRSFAGQFLSVLNVPRDGLLDAYLRVVASLHSPEAIHYRLLHGIPGETAQMAVGFIVMIDSVASGIMFSADPTHPEAETILIHAVRGLGVRLADGSSSAERILVSSEDREPTITRAVSHQSERVVCGPDAGLLEQPVETKEAGEPCLSDEEATLLSRWARTLERHFGRPQDIEWALDSHRQPVLLQSRPLLLLSPETRAATPIAGFRVLLSSGEVASPGVGAGPAFHMDEDGEMEAFPPGAVLIARRSSPKFVRLMDKAGAIVTDAGSTTGHMASLAREFRVTTLLNTGLATRRIPQGILVTVDASSGFVYEGELTSLLSQKISRSGEVEAGHRRRETPAFHLLEKAVEFIAPLRLTDPRSSGFSAENCTTLHDLARFAHEMSYEEMFRMGGKLGDFRPSSYYLDVFLPMELYIVDLGGGLEPPAKGRTVKLKNVKSIPLTALLKGMLDDRIPRFGPRPMDLSGFVSVMMRHALTTPEQERTFRDPCYAIVSDRYLNYTARVGYHFGVVDAYCGFTRNKNYISFHFKGGAADWVRRSRRVQAIAAILKEHGFSVLVTEDLVNARIRRGSRDETAEKLEMIGRLLQFFRQMDAAMTSDESVKLFQDAFLSGDYAMAGENHPPDPA
jgi:pyruvate,water dikinase